MRKKITALTLCIGIFLTGCTSVGDTTSASSGAGLSSNSSQGASTPTSTPKPAPASTPVDGQTSYEKLFANGPILAQNTDGLWGYIDSAGNYVVEPRFRDAYEFQENGLAAVQDSETGLWGYINTSGEYAIEAKYSQVSPNGFKSNGLAAVYEAGTNLSGYIDESGEYAFPPLSDSTVSDFINGLAIVGPPGAVYYIDETGEQVYPETFNEAYHFSEDWAPVIYWGDYGYLDRSGEFYAFPDAQDVSRFQNGRAFVKLANGKWRMIDETLQFVSDAEFDYIRLGSSHEDPFELWKDAGNWDVNGSGRCIVSTETQGADGSLLTNYYVIDIEGNVVFPTDGKHYTAMWSGESQIVVNEAETFQMGVIDADGNWLIPLRDQRISSVSEDGIRLSTDSLGQNNKFIDQEGNTVWESTNPGISVIGHYRDILTVQITDEESPNLGMFSYADHDGNLITDLTFSLARDFSKDSSYARAAVDGLWGIIDGEGNWLIEPKFQSFADTWVVD